jgi:hypothetical protein
MDYKDKVIEYTGTNFKTVMIGSIDAFEKEFAEELKDSDFKARFQGVRKKILDIGNDQKRRTERVLDKSQLRRGRYSYTFQPVSNFDSIKLEGILGDSNEG